MPQPLARRTFSVHPLAAAAALALLVPGAHAQDAAPPEAGKLQTVTVTAERRVENIRDVPSSISTLSGEALDVINSSGQDIRALAARVPSLNIESSFGRIFPRFFIRGLGNSDFDLNASQPVSLVYDDVVQENPMLKGFPLFDVAQVEVLRGPQGTLFGRNTTAGVVKVESVKPVLKKSEGYVSIGAGTFSTVNLDGAFNLAVSDVLAARISLQTQHRGDWVTNTNAAGPTKEMEGYDDTAGRVQFLYQPTKDFSALFNVHGRKLDGTARVFHANMFKPGTNDIVDGFDRKKVSHDGKNEQDLTSDGASLRLRWNLGAITLHSITGYEHVEVLSRGDIDGGFGDFRQSASGPGFIPFDAESADGLPKHRQFTQELRVESNASGPLKWQGGLYYFDEEIAIDSFNYSSIRGNVQNGYATQHQENRAYALFGSVNFKVSDALELRGGLRYTKDKKDFFADRLQAPPFSPSFLGRISTATSATNTSGDLSATYALDKTTNVYGRVATGFRAPSIQGRLLFGDIVSVADSEKVTSYEAGVKSDFMGGRARISAGAFHYTIKDQQLTAVGGNANFNQLVNAEKTIGKGFEVDFKLLATDNLLLGLSASYNDTKIRDKNLSIDACGSGCTILDPITAPANPAQGKFAPTVSIDGNPLPQAPKVVVNLNARYAIPTPNGEWYVYTDWSHRSKINFFLYESVEFTGKSLTEGGLRIGYIWGNGKYEAAVFGRNITDEVRAVGGIDFNNLLGFVNEPRTFGAQFKMSF
jgi:iron complex outermembrane receptor protein